MRSFATKADVVAYLTELEGLGLLASNGAGWDPAGPYALSPGELAAPDYQPSRYKDGWGIAKNTYFYPGVPDEEPERYRVDLSICGGELKES